MAKLLRNSPYNPITDEEWRRFWDVCDLSHLSEKEQQKVRQLFQEGAENHPYYRRLIRGKRPRFQ